MSDLAQVQKKLGVPASGSWDGPTQAAVAAFQGSHGLLPTGELDVPTAAALDLYDPFATATPEQRQYFQDGKDPGHFGRDFAGALSQIPRWVWVTGSVGFFAGAYYSYRLNKKKKRRRS